MPELKIWVAAFGVLQPEGQTRELVRVVLHLKKFLAIWFRSTAWLIEAEATMFSMLTIALAWVLAGPNRWAMKGA